MKIYLQQDGASAGPFDEASVRERLDHGTLAPDVYAWREGLADWQPLGTLLAPPPPISDRGPAAAARPAASPTAPDRLSVKSPMPWWAKTLLGLAALLTLVVLLAAGTVVFVIYKSEHPTRRSENTLSARDSDAAFDQEMAEVRAKVQQEQADIRAEIERDIADTAHYEVTEHRDPDGATTTTVTPKDRSSGGQPITRTVDAQGKTTTTKLDAQGNTVTQTTDTHGNVSTVTTPKGG